MRGRSALFPTRPEASGRTYLHLDGHCAGAGAAAGGVRVSALVGHQHSEPVQPLPLVVQRLQEANLPWKGEPWWPGPQGHSGPTPKPQPSGWGGGEYR